MESLMRSGNQQRAFTLVELLVVLSILALLLTLAVPRYFKNIERAKEATLKQDLETMRKGIDQFYADKGRYPDSLESLKSLHYINKLPIDPFTESNDTWLIIPPEAPLEGQVYDVRSSSDGKAEDGSAFADW